MMRHKHIIPLILLGATLLWAGSARADFRHSGMGARPKAMGSAYVALADDANAAYWNPAGCGQDDRVTLMVTRAWLFGVEGLYNDYLAAQLPSWGDFHFGASWVRLGLEGIYSENTLNLAVSHHMPFLEGLSLGVAGKMFLLEAPGYEQYNDPNYNGGDHDWSMDLGFLYDSGGAWTLGGTLYNLTTPSLQLLENTSSPDPVYTEFAVGGSYYFRDTLLMTADFRDREGEWDNIVLHGGAEIWFYDALVLRTGLDSSMVTLGAGLQDKHWQADFSLETNKKLGNVYMFSFTVRN